jgi:hypothetical protein
MVSGVGEMSLAGVPPGEDFGERGTGQTPTQEESQPIATRVEQPAQFTLPLPLPLALSLQPIRDHTGHVDLS